MSISKFFALAIIGLFVVTSSSFAGGKNFSLNNNVGKNQIKFDSEAPVETINGIVNTVNGNFTMDMSNFEATTGTIGLNIADMKTGVEKRDEHMRGSDWLNADKNPQIKYQITKLSGLKTSSENGKFATKGTVEGNFTLNGVTKYLKGTVSINYIQENAETKKRAAGDIVNIQAKIDVPLADFGIKGKSGVLGNKVANVVKISAVLFANSN
jgi:polyisoprenoid-binding protein YceI